MEVTFTSAIFIALTIGLMTLFIFKNTQRNPKTNKSNLKAGQKLTVTLKERQQLSHDTFNFVFSLPDTEVPFGIPVGSHYMIHAQVNGKQVDRKYTPTSVFDLNGTFEQVIKIYRPNVHPKFPEGGELTPYLETLPIGSKVEVSGPHGNLEYYGKGKMRINRANEGLGVQKRTFKKIYMIAGGTGITPMYQIIQQVARVSTDTTEIFILYANKSEEDILLRQELEAYAANKNLNLHYTLDVPPTNWNHFGGFVTIDMLRKVFLEVNDDALCVSCGPPPMVNLAKRLFLEMGFKEGQYFKF